MVFADSTVIQLDWAGVAAIATPVSAAIGAAARFGWNALFAYLTARDKSRDGLHAEVLGKVSELGHDILTLGEHVVTLDQSFKQANEQSRQDFRDLNNRLINALTANTNSNQQVAQASAKLADTITKQSG